MSTHANGSTYMFSIGRCVLVIDNNRSSNNTPTLACVHALSNNLIMVDRKKLKNPNGLMDECRIKRYTECGNGRCYKPNHCRTFFDNGIKSVPTFVMKVRNL